MRIHGRDCDQVLPLDQAHLISASDQQKLVFSAEQLALLSSPPSTCSSTSAAGSEQMKHVKELAFAASVCKHMFACCQLAASN